MRTYSHSALSSYETCPLQYKFRYIDRIKRIFPSVESFMGSRVHEVLERLYRDVLMAKVPKLEELLAFYDEQWGKHWQGGIQIVKENYGESDYRRLGSRCIENYYRRYHPFDDAKTLALEKRVSMTISEDDGYRIIGYIDRVAQADEGVYEIHDYKTSGSLPEQSKLDEDRQLGLYQMAVEEIYRDARAIKLIWHYLVFDKAMKSSRTPEELQELRERIVALIREVESREEFPPREGPLCPWCDYQDRCPVRKHLFKVAELPPEEYVQESGVKLVNEYIRLQREKKEKEAELGKLKEAIVDYCSRNKITNLIGSNYKIGIRDVERSYFPSRTSDLERYLELCRILKEAGRLEEVSKISNSLLKAAIDSGCWDDELMKKIKEYQRVEKSVVLKPTELKNDG